MKEIKTMDGVLVEKERVECVAMILAQCDEKRMKTLEIHEKFMDYAERFIMFLTEEELKDFVAHHVAIELLNYLNK